MQGLLFVGIDATVMQQALEAGGNRNAPVKVRHDVTLDCHITQHTGRYWTTWTPGTSSWNNVLHDIQISIALPPARPPPPVGFEGGKDIWVRDCLNLGVHPKCLLEILRAKFEGLVGGCTRAVSLFDLLAACCVRDSL